MDEMNAFDRQLASVVVKRVGPSRPVNDAAIFTAITATQAPKWRFQSIFSATKFVVAGAIVALFGGFLLAGVLTQPSEEQMPAVGAPASSEAWRTDVATSPSTTRSNLIPGAELTVEEITPTVFRVLDDGAEHALDRIWHVATTPDGSVWVLARDQGYSDDTSIFRLGDPGSFTSVDGVPKAFALRSGADGRLYAEASPWAVLDDTEWVDATPADPFTYRESPGDGTTWAIANIRPVELGILRRDRSGTSEYSLEDMHFDGLEGYGNFMSEAIDPKALALGPGGRVWSLWSARATNGAPPGLGLAEFDGTSWRDITPDQWRIGTPEARNEGGRPGSILDATLSVAPDGTLRVAALVYDLTIAGLGLEVPARRVEATWDGHRWTVESRAAWDIASVSEVPDGLEVLAVAAVAPDSTMVLRKALQDQDARLGDVHLYVLQPEREAITDGDGLTVQPTTPDLLPGVDLVTEEVEPGVYRVLSDGIRDLSDIGAKS